MTYELAVPMLVCHDAASEIEFCKAAFRAVEVSRHSAEDGSVIHATLKIGSAMLMVHGEVPKLASKPPKSDGTSPVVIYLYLPDVDAAIDRAKSAGAQVLIPTVDAIWGDRVGRIIDPSGHVWNVATRPVDERKA